MPTFPRSAEFLFQFCPVEDATRASLRLDVPVLAGEPRETLFAGLREAGRAEDFGLFAAGDWLVGVRVEPLRADVAAQTEAIYAGLLTLTGERGRVPARIWNYVGGINADCAEGLETYRAFCRGRSLAFERAGWTGPVPAASAVGGQPGMIAVLFAAARENPLARENPEQMPAYEYPPDYGPRSPSFSRAMRVSADGRAWTFVSGTAAIKGHRSMATGDLAGQIACTRDNLRLISEACGLGADLAADTDAERHFKIYLRHAGDLAAARAALEGGLLRPADRVTWLRADICRAELLIEIEATVIARGAA